jgi:hypothetical protein
MLPSCSDIKVISMNKISFLYNKIVVTLKMTLVVTTVLQSVKSSPQSVFLLYFFLFASFCYIFFQYKLPNSFIGGIIVVNSEKNEQKIIQGIAPILCV